MRFFPAALLLTLSFATGGFAQEAPAAAPAESETPKEGAVKPAEGKKAPAGKEEAKKSAAAAAAGGMRGMGGGDGSGKKPFPLHILVDISQSVGSGTAFGFNKDENPKNYEISNDTGDLQPFNANTATTLFLMPMANYQGFSLTSMMWYSFEETLADNPNGQPMSFGDPLTRVGYPIRISELNLMINPSVAFTLPLSYRSGYLGRFGVMGSSSANWSWKGLIVSGNVNLGYNYDNPSLSRGDKEGREFNDRSLGLIPTHLVALRMGQDSSAVFGNTAGPFAFGRIGATYVFLDVFSVAANVFLRTTLRNPMPTDEFTAEQAEGGTTPIMAIQSTTSNFILSGNYQIFSWLGLYVSYSAAQQLVSSRGSQAEGDTGRGYEPMDYDEYKSGTQTTDLIFNPIIFDPLNGSQNSMSLAAGMTFFF